MSNQTTTFRSVLPHEPSPQDELGFVHLQGGLTPKPPKSKSKEQKAESTVSFWESPEQLQQALTERLADTDFCQSLNIPVAAQHIQLLDTQSPYTKVRLTYSSPVEAQSVVQHIRLHPLTPAQLFHNYSNDSDFTFATRPFSSTRITQQPIPPNSWTRANPPKFRRLLPRPNEPAERLAQERQSTRFVYVTNLLTPNEENEQFWRDAYTVAAALRSVFGAYDTSGHGVEIFVSPPKKLHQHCHVGLRSPSDAQKLIHALQEQQVQWKLPHMNDFIMIESGKLFVDYAAVTDRSNRQLELRAQGKELEKGEPSRPECTSTTTDVIVPGLILVPDACSPDEEQALLAVLLGPQAPWAPSQATPTEGGVVKRRVQHYGYVFDYETADVLRDRSSSVIAQCPPLPVLTESKSDDRDLDVEEQLKQAVDEGRGWNVLAGIIERTRHTVFTDEHKSESLNFPNLNQVTVNHYAPGEGIGSHVDTPSAFGDGLLSLSLGSGIVMEFRKVNGNGKKKLLYLPPRSIVAMTGEARYEWEHHIVTRRTDQVDGQVLPRQRRVSLTFRTALTTTGSPLPRVTSSQFPPVWATGNADGGTSSSYADTPECERDHVHKVYDAIATQWHHTRGRRGVLWPGATQFLERLPQGSLVADVGCGDGKYFPAIIEAGSFVIGSDISRPLLETSFGREDSNAPVPESRRVSSLRQPLCTRPAVAVADCMSVPLRDECCDAAICIAVLHHLSTRERRLRCIEELARIVKPGGVMNIQAWAMDQAKDSKRRFASDDVYVPFNAQPKYLQLPSEKTEQSDKSTAQVYADAFENADYDDRKGLVVFQRYCHLYRQGELEELVDQVPQVKLLESGYETGNYFVIIEKK